MNKTRLVAALAALFIPAAIARADDSNASSLPSLRDSLSTGPSLAQPSPASAEISVWPPQPPPAAVPRAPTTPAEAVYTANNWQPPPAAPFVPQPAPAVLAPSFAFAPRTVESSWYTRIDWYHWSETIDGANFVTESGPLYTLGYQRRIGSERFRAEMFGSSVHYSAALQFDDGTSEPISSRTDLLGVRAEYDYLFQPDWPRPINFFVGIGTRFWIRNLPDFTDDFGNQISGYQETWWTTYPYLGIESRHDEAADYEFYGRGRVGIVAITYEHLTLNQATLFPGPGVTAALELGVRGEWLFLAGYAEVFTWRQSNVERDLQQPSSLLLTVGVKTGVNF